MSGLPRRAVRVSVNASTRRPWRPLASSPGARWEGPRYYLMRGGRANDCNSRTLAELQLVFDGERQTRDVATLARPDQRP